MALVKLMIFKMFSKATRLCFYVLEAIKRFIWKNVDLRHRENYVAFGVLLRKATLEGSVRIGRRVRLSGEIVIGRYTTIDRDCIIHGGRIEIGKYSQIGPNVGIYALNHGLNFLTIYNNQSLFNGRLKTLNEVSNVRIGSDVWIGYGAIILPDVCIGDGAIIGAGTVVTKDIEAYNVVVGNPGRVIRKRFETKVIELLQQWRWWELDPEDLLEFEELFMIDLTQNTMLAIVKLEEIVARNQHRG